MSKAQICIIKTIEGRFGYVKRGEKGYYPAPGVTDKYMEKFNRTMGLSQEDVEKMLTCSMVGWHLEESLK